MYLAAALYQRYIYVHNLVFPDQDTNEEVDHGQRGNDWLDHTVHQPNQQDDGVIGHLQHPQLQLKACYGMCNKVNTGHAMDSIPCCSCYAESSILISATQVKYGKEANMQHAAFA